MKKNIYFPSSDGKTRIHAAEWIPEGDVKAILQISHGMVEHIMRYTDFAEYLNKSGILVVGNDHLGHGESVVSDDMHGYFAEQNGNEYVVADLHKLRTYMQTRFPEVPYFMLGHSMGSFLIRKYMMMHGSGLSGVIVMGTGSQPTVTLASGMLLCKMIATVRGWHYRSRMVDNIAFAAYNKGFRPARTQKDWLTKDEAIVDRYLADPWCTFSFTLNGFYNLFRTIAYIQKKQNIDSIPKHLPVLFVSGDQDPVGNCGKGVTQAYEALLNRGMDQVRMKLYEGDRHEILNELDRSTVYGDLLAWMQERMRDCGRNE